MGGELYQRLKDHLKEHLVGKAAQATMIDEDLLIFYTAKWGEFTNSASTLNHILAYLNRHWVKRELDEGARGVYDIYTVFESLTTGNCTQP
jgi:cullin 1